MTATAIGSPFDESDLSISNLRFSSAAANACSFSGRAPLVFLIFDGFAPVSESNFSGDLVFAEIHLAPSSDFDFRPEEAFSMIISKLDLGLLEHPFWWDGTG